MRDAAMIQGAVKPAGHYSHAVVANGFAYVSGQGPADPETGAMADDIAGQVGQTLRNLEFILKGVGTRLSDVIKMNVYLSDMALFADYDAAYRNFFPDSPPARTTIGCQLAGILVEIDCVAVLPAKP